MGRDPIIISQSRKLEFSGIRVERRRRRRKGRGVKQC
jgi:hypothetical protein